MVDYSQSPISRKLLYVHAPSTPTPFNADPKDKITIANILSNQIFENISVLVM